MLLAAVQVVHPKCPELQAEETGRDDPGCDQKGGISVT